MISRMEEYGEKAERREALAKREKDPEVRVALLHSARQWRGRARLLAQRGYR
jgi:sirohydrochlorin ferrochelatase